MFRVWFVTYYYCENRTVIAIDYISYYSLYEGILVRHLLHISEHRHEYITRSYYSSVYRRCITMVRHQSIKRYAYAEASDNTCKSPKQYSLATSVGTTESIEPVINYPFVHPLHGSECVMCGTSGNT